MGKLRDFSKRGRAVKVVPFRLANAPLLPAGVDTDEHTLKVGVKVLRPDEIGDALKAALADTVSDGVPQWLDTHPLCRLREMEHVVLRACVDVDSELRAEPFFDSLEQLRTDDGMGGDNLAYLYEQWKAWQDECAGPSKNPTLGEIVAMVIEEAGRPENAEEGPFSRLRLSAQRSCMHTMAVLLASSIATKSPPSSEPETSTASSSTPSGPKPPASKPKKTPKTSRTEGEA